MKIRNTDFCKIKTIGASDQNSYAVLEKWIFENFRGPSYDDVIYKNDNYLWSNEELKIKVKDLVSPDSLGV